MTDISCSFCVISHTHDCETAHYTHYGVRYKQGAYIGFFWVYLQGNDVFVSGIGSSGKDTLRRLLRGSPSRKAAITAAITAYKLGIKNAWFSEDTDYEA